MTTILVVEDEPAISKAVVDNLEFEGYSTLTAFDGHMGLQMATTQDVDLILLDIMLPGMNGYDLCRRLREGGRLTPVIMLTAKGEEVDKVLGLELGADDYITKPVGVREFRARVKAVLRRSHGAQMSDSDSAVLTIGAARVDFDRYETTVDGESVHLSPKAYGVLKLLWQRRGNAVSRSEILQEVWGCDVYPTTRTIDNHVAELRAALEDETSGPQHLLTVHGVGYKLVVNDDREST